MGTWLVGGISLRMEFRFGGAEEDQGHGFKGGVGLVFANRAVCTRTRNLALDAVNSKGTLNMPSSQTASSHATAAEPR